MSAFERILAIADEETLNREAGADPASREGSAQKKTTEVLSATTVAEVLGISEMARQTR